MKTLPAGAALGNATRRHALARDGSSVAQLATDLVGLHNTSPVTPYLSLLARLPNFTRSDLDRLMWESWELVRFRAMRLTMFVFPRDLLEIAAAATRHIGQPFAARWLRDSGLSAGQFEDLARRIEEALQDGPLTARAVRAELEAPQEVDVPGVLGRLCDMGRVVGGRPPRVWRSPVREYHLWESVVPDVNLRRWDEEQAISELVDRYIRCYGPVTIDDISWWTGITKGRCRSAIERLTDIEQVSVTGWNGPLYRHPDSAIETPTDAVAALPLLDPYVQGYRDRDRFLDADRHDFVYDGGGNATATIVCAGRIVGVWQPATKPDSIRYHLFADGPAFLRPTAEDRLSRTGSLYFDGPVDVVRVETMEPLSAGGGRSAAHPLDGTIHRASRRQGNG